MQILLREAKYDILLKSSMDDGLDSLLEFNPKYILECRVGLLIVSSVSRRVEIDSL